MNDKLILDIREFGKTKFFVLGIGTVWFGRWWPPDTDFTMPKVEEVNDYLDEVFTNIEGTVMIDTAAAYGLSEERIGEYFKKRKKLLPRVFIATKWGEEFRLFGDGTGTSTLKFSKENLIASVKRSRLRLPKIDLLYIHRTTLDVLRNQEIIDEMRKMDIRYIGASISNEKVLEIGVDLIDELDVIQMPTHIFLKRADLVNKIREKGISIVLNSVVRKGGGKSAKELYAELLPRQDFFTVLTGTRHHLKETIGYVKTPTTCA